MPALHKPVSALHREDEQLPVATFKTSLRAWQARYQAQGGTPAPGSRKAPRQAVRA
jgi:hypothetical protein